MPRKIDISHKTIIFITLFILGLWVLYLIMDILILLFVAIILTSALAPFVSFFVKNKLPKVLGIIIAYIIMLSVLGSIGVIIFNPLVDQSMNLVTTLPPLLAERFNITNIDQNIFNDFAGVSGNIVSVSLIVFNNIITIILLLVLTFYLLLEREQLEQRVAALFGKREQQIKYLIVKIEEKLGAWFIGQLLLSLIIGTLTYIGLYIFKIPYALPLALLAGVMEVVPVIGPIIAAIPAIAIAATIDPVVAGGVAVMYFIIQQLENHVVVPQVMKRAVGLNPLVVIIAVAVGSRLLGIGGALLAVPLVVVIQIIVSEIVLENK